MSNMQINSVLSQIRALQSQIKTPAPLHDATGTQSTQSVPGSKFSDLLKSGLDSVNQSQLRADDLATAFQRGVPGVELADVMIEMQKANVSFRAATEVRNRMVSAYQDIMNMQI